MRKISFVFICCVLVFSGCSTKLPRTKTLGDALARKPDVEVFLSIPLDANWLPQEFKADPASLQKVELVQESFTSLIGSLPQGSQLQIWRNKKNLIEMKTLVPAIGRPEKKWNVLKKAWFAQTPIQSVRSPCAQDKSSLQVNLTQGVAVKISEAQEVLELIFASERLLEALLIENAHKKCDF